MSVADPSACPSPTQATTTATTAPTTRVTCHHPWCRISLKFVDPGLEHSYASSVLHNSQVSMDCSLCFHKLWITLLLMAGIFTGAVHATPLGMVLWCTYTCSLGGHYAIMKLVPGSYASCRPWAIMLLKVALAANQVALVPTYVLQPAHSTLSYLQVLLLGAGLVMQLCTGVCMPMFWRRHVPFALVTFVAYNAIMLKPLAQSLVCTPVASSLTAQLYLAADTAAFTLGRLLQLYPLQQHSSAAQPVHQAFILVLWLQLLVALLLPCACLYLFEARSREAFWQRMRRQRHTTQQAQAGAAATPTAVEGGASSSIDASTSGDAQATAAAEGCIDNGSGGSRSEAAGVSTTSRHQAPLDHVLHQADGAVASSSDAEADADADADVDVDESAGQPLVLLITMALLLALLLWNGLHSWVVLLVRLLDQWQLPDLMARLAVVHGKAAGCL